MGDASTFEEPFAALILALLILRRSTSEHDRSGYRCCDSQWKISAAAMLQNGRPRARKAPVARGKEQRSISLPLS
jgi:hypothetical protein